MRKRMERTGGRGGFLSGISVWALSFGCVVGWGSFVMPGTTFLPGAGPVGTILGVAIAAGMILTVGLNYSYLAQRFSGTDGSYAYTKSILGDDHAFLSVWSLALAYLSLLWANATAFILIGRYLIGDVLQWGFYFRVAGYDVYLGEVVVTAAILILFGLITCYAKRLAAVLRTVLALFHFCAVVALFIGVAVHRGGVGAALTPAFSNTEPRGLQVLNIAILAPWMFVGFETAAFTVGRSRLSVRRIFAAALAAIVTGMSVYILLTLIGAAGTPAGYADWRAYVADLGSLEGIDGMPVLYNVRAAMGDRGIRLLGVAILATLSTSVLGFYRASAGVIATMAGDGLLPARLARVKNGVPRNAVWAIMLISLPIPLLGRTAVGWNADVSTLTVAIVYAYVSICARKTAKAEKNRPRQLAGGVGVASSALVFFFLLVPNIFSENALATESYFMLAGWSLLGIAYYWLIFRRDRESRFGRSTIMWIMMLFLLFFSANVWVRLDTQERLRDLPGGAEVSGLLMRNSLIMMGLMVVILLVMFSLFSIMHRRARELDLKIIQSEERNRAKSSFLSNMSHDIRTPMNAIIGFTDLASRSPEDTEKVREYLGKIQASSNHLLSLINDVLEMSRIESGKIELEETPVSLPEVLHDLNTIIIGQVEAKQQELTMDAVHVVNEDVWCDRLRLNQVLLNLLSNSVKYTPAGGKISVRLIQNDTAPEGFGSYEIHVRDNGIGMTPEFAAKVFDAFEREKSATVSGIQGTGLGMAITKRIVDLMGGTIEVDTALGEGTEFTVRVLMRIQTEKRKSHSIAELAGVHALVVDDDYDICDSTTRMLSEMGLRAEWTVSGKEAVLRARQARERGNSFGIFIIDWKLPDLNGIEAARQIRGEVGPSCPILLMTAYDWPEIRNEALAAGVSGFCSKPLFPSELHHALLSAIGSGQEPEAEQKEQAPSRSFAGKRLLLVDDIDVNREIAVMLLQMNDFELEEARDGREALEMVAASAPGYYDAVLMDIQMPVMNGYEAARAIRALDDPALAGVPIIAMTANAFDEDKRAAMDAGMNGHVAKPIDMAELISVLDTLLTREEDVGTYVI